MPISCTPSSPARSPPAVPRFTTYAGGVAASSAATVAAARTLPGPVTSTGTSVRRCTASSCMRHDEQRRSRLTVPRSSMATILGPWVHDRRADARSRRAPRPTTPARRPAPTPRCPSCRRTPSARAAATSTPATASPCRSTSASSSARSRPASCGCARTRITGSPTAPARGRRAHHGRRQRRRGALGRVVAGRRPRGAGPSTPPPRATVAVTREVDGVVHEPVTAVGASYPLMRVFTGPLVRRVGDGARRRRARRRRPGRPRPVPRARDELAHGRGARRARRGGRRRRSTRARRTAGSAAPTARTAREFVVDPGGLLLAYAVTSPAAAGRSGSPRSRPWRADGLGGVACRGSAACRPARTSSSVRWRRSACVGPLRWTNQPTTTPVPFIAQCRAEGGNRLLGVEPQQREHHAAEPGEQHRREHRRDRRAAGGVVRLVHLERRADVPQAEQERRERDAPDGAAHVDREREQHAAERELLDEHRAERDVEQRPARGGDAARPR